jgi:transposase
MRPGFSTPCSLDHRRSWFASDFVSDIRVLITPHPVGPSAPSRRVEMTQHDPRRDRLGRRAKRFLSPTEKYELWLQLATGELSQSEAAERFGIDRSTVMRIRQVAKQGALEALAASKPGVRQAREDAELAAARAEIARLGEAVKEQAIELMLLRGKSRWG